MPIPHFCDLKEISPKKLRFAWHTQEMMTDFFNVRVIFWRTFFLFRVFAIHSSNC